MGKYFVVLNARCHGLTAIAARWDKKGAYVPEAFSRTHSDGFGDGLVIDIALASKAIGNVINKLSERVSAKRLHDVYCGINSTSINTFRSSGVSILSKYGRPVSRLDIERCIEMASTVKMPLEKEPLHKIVSGFYLDGDGQIKNPLDLEGVKLAMDINMLTINSSVLHNMSKCVAQSGLVPRGFIFSTLGLANRALSKSDIEEGAILLDICRDTTSSILFFSGILINAKVFASGLNNFLTGDNKVNMEEVQKIFSELKALTGWEHIRKCAVLGEGAFNEALVESLERIFGFPAIAGSCTIKPEENEFGASVEYAEALGILDYLMEERNKEYGGFGALRIVRNRFRDFVDRYF